MTDEESIWEFSCPLGSYCKDGKQTQCPQGYYGIMERASDAANGCAECPSGYVCQPGTSNYELYPCPRGYYCPNNSTVKVAEACPAGYYNDLLYGRTFADCKLCKAGMQCETAQRDEGVVCEEGMVCPRGSSPQQYPCPLGTYGGYSKGKVDISQCLICPSGYYCGQEGTINPTPISAGLYSPNQGLTSELSAFLCPPGYYCPYTNMTSYKGFHCTEGFVCPAGSTSNIAVPCPAGTFSDRRRLHNTLDCELCPKGFTCAQASSTAVGITECPANHYCGYGTAY